MGTKQYLSAAITVAALLILVPGLDASAQSTVQFTAEEQEWLDRNPTVNLGYEPAWAPLEYIDSSGNLAGLSGDLAAEFSVLGGSSFEAVSGLTWVTSLEGIRDGTVDAVFMAQATDERRTTYNMAFSEPWIVVPNNIITKGDRADITAGSLGSFRVVGVAGYAINDWIRDNYPGVNIVEAASYGDALRAVESGTADAFVDPWVVASREAANNGVSGLANSGSLPADADYRLTVGYNADNAIFGSIIQKMLDAVEASQASDTTIGLTDAERAWLALNPTVNLGYEPAWAPLEYIDSSGNLAGLSGDLAAEFSVLGGSSFEAVPGLTWVTSLEGIRDGTVDAVFMAQATDERRTTYNMAFSEPWIVVPNNIITKGDRADITAGSLGSFRVVGVAGYAINDWIRDNYPGVSVTEVTSYGDALRAVESGTADAFVDPWVVASREAANNGVSGLANSGSLPADADYRLTVGYNADNAVFGSIVQKMLDAGSIPTLSEATGTSARVCR